MDDLKYRVGTFREAGLEARWSKVRGAPIIVVRNPNANTNHQREQWWVCDKYMFEDMKKDGIIEAFDNHTILGDILSI